MMIRTATLADSKSFAELLRRIDRESKNMLREPDEQTLSGEQAEAMIEKFGQSPNSCILVAEEDGQLVGYCVLSGSDLVRTRHSTRLVLGVLQAHADQGIGTALLKMIDEFAATAGIHRTELTVRKDNARAIHLYHKMGFEIEGTKRDSLFVDGVYVDELYMAKLYEIEV